MPKKPAMSPSGESVDQLIAALPEGRQEDAHRLRAMMQEITGEDAVVWASRIIGFGAYRYRYATGWEGVAPLIGFATSGRHHTVYMMADFGEGHDELLARLGKVKLGKGCVYVNKLADIDLDAFRELAVRSVQVYRDVDEKYGMGQTAQ
ncbi:DUF1801 domain-containing protein [Rhodococcus sp. NPDC058521]|uniref:DUF1801 domain-containing protein n=1 Tax=Rhodococcus sp. NPDC058521 TaxID=3346536 RepID=UPI0036572B25